MEIKIKIKSTDQNNFKILRKYLFLIKTKNNKSNILINN